MSLVFDESGLGDRPGVHALIAGVSAYRHLSGGSGPPAPDSFGMQQLGSAALSAYRVYQWLVESKHRLPVPLATIRLLLSPSEAETAVEPGLAYRASSCLHGQFCTEAKQWQRAASQHPDNVAFFYFAGHGVQRNNDDAVLLMEDFGAGDGGTLGRAVATNNLVDGMAPSSAEPGTSRLDMTRMARRQLFFVDSCRVLPSAFRNFERMTVPDVFDVELGQRDDRQVPVFYGAIPGARAYAVRGDQTLFSKALLRCLSGGAGEHLKIDEVDRWCITSHALADGLRACLDELSLTLHADQDFTVGGHSVDFVICYLDGPPPVDLVLRITPDEAIQRTKVLIRDNQEHVVAELPPPLTPHPYRQPLAAGTYGVVAEVQPPDPRYTRYARWDPVMPPGSTWTVRVSP